MSHQEKVSADGILIHLVGSPLPCSEEQDPKVKALEAFLSGVQFYTSHPSNLGRLSLEKHNQSHILRMVKVGSRELTSY
jgi:hypothetical protein